MESLPANLKKINSEISLILRSTDISRLPAKSRDQLAQLAQNLHDSRIYLNDYELSETREEQLKNAKNTKKYLAKAGGNIVAASQADVFKPIDVAQLSAQIEDLIERIK
jgi:protein subunit release factor B